MCTPFGPFGLSFVFLIKKKAPLVCTPFGLSFVFFVKKKAKGGTNKGGTNKGGTNKGVQPKGVQTKGLQTKGKVQTKVKTVNYTDLIRGNWVYT